MRRPFGPIRARETGSHVISARTRQVVYREWRAQDRNHGVTDESAYSQPEWPSEDDPRAKLGNSTACARDGGRPSLACEDPRGSVVVSVSRRISPAALGGERRGEGGA